MYRLLISLMGFLMVCSSLQAVNDIPCNDTCALYDSLIFSTEAKNLSSSTINVWETDHLPFAIYHPSTCKFLSLTLREKNNNDFKIEVLDEYGHTIKLFTDNTAICNNNIVQLDIGGLETKEYFLIGSFQESTEIRKLIIE